MKSRYRRYSKPVPRNITVRYAGKCACCGATIEAGTWATYYPAGTMAGVHVGQIAHTGGLDGNSATCAAKLRADVSLNDYAGDGLDQRYEDDCRDRCGL